MKRVKLPTYKLNQERQVSVQIYEFLRQLIVENYLLPDDKISENEIAAHFNVSRMPVRVAINGLINCGLVEVFPQKGSFVTKISVKNLNEICFMRCAIETSSLKEGLKLTDKNYNKIVNKLAKNLEKQQALKANKQNNTQQGKLLTLDDDFHATICMFSNTQLAWDTLQKLKSNMDRIRYLTIGDTISSIEHIVSDHEALFDAIKNKNIKTACNKLSTHLYEITETYIKVQAENAQWFVADD